MTNTEQTTVVGIFSDERAARQVVDELIGQGFSKDKVHLGSQDDYATNAAMGGSKLTGQAPSEHHSGGFMHWLEGLFGRDTPEDERAHYAEAVRRGNYLVTVDADKDGQDRAADIMNDNGALDIDKAVAAYRERGYTGYDPNAKPYTGAELDREREWHRNQFGNEDRTNQDDTRGNTRSIPVIQEELQIGKRSVQRGGVRIYSHTTDQPVEEQITLRDEKVKVDRRPVNRAVTQADENAMRDQTFEVTETREEPVISKSRRVVEEVSVGKEATERTETVKDTVRRTEVKVEKLGSDAGSKTSGQDWRQDFKTRYGNTGASYDTYAPAYDYGYRTASDSRYRDRGFDDVESDLKTDYLRNNPNSDWDKSKGAIRYGWEKVTGKR